jgi:hypothetical protein
MALPDYPRKEIAAIQSHLDAAVVHPPRQPPSHRPWTASANGLCPSCRQCGGGRTSEESQRRTEKRGEELQRSLFGLPSPGTADVLVMRDSQDRASTLVSAEDAALKMQLANQSGDKFMAQAIAQVAVAKGWGDVVDSYASGNTYTRERLDELAAIPSGRRTELADAAVFRIRTPRELLGRNDDVLAAYEPTTRPL